MNTEPGMRVLDMRCGKAISSIFLAKEFDVQVWATDPWIKPTLNCERIRDAGLEKQVFPIHTEARYLPFADDFFDAIIRLDSYYYYYYGTEMTGTWVGTLLASSNRADRSRSSFLDW